MKTAFRTAVVFFSVFVIAKLIFFNAGLHEKYFVVLVFINILLVLLAMIFTLIPERKTNPRAVSTYFELVKTCLRPAALYTVLVTAFLYLYYNNIDPSYCQNRINERILLAEKVDYPALQKKHKELGELSHHDYIELVKKDAELYFSPFLVATVSLLGLLILSFFYSMVIAFVYRKFLFP